MELTIKVRDLRRLDSIKLMWGAQVKTIENDSPAPGIATVTFYYHLKPWHPRMDMEIEIERPSKEAK